MNDTELLQAISEMMDKKLKPIQQDVSDLKQGQELLQQEVAGLTVGQDALKQAQIMADIKMEKGQNSLQQQIVKTNIILENDISKKMGALFDGHALDTEMIKHISETIDDIDAAMTAVDIVTKANIKEINKLKTKIG